METKTNVPMRRQGFTNRKKQFFDKVNEVAYKAGEMSQHLGEYVTETEYNSRNIFQEENDGVYIYRSYSDPNVGYRIYKAFADYGFDGHRDDELIQKLAEKQPSIKLTQFPTGVLTLEGNVIGQEIRFYPNEITVREYVDQFEVTPNKLFAIYYGILDAVNEMAGQGIFYLDVHGRNFMINPQLSDVCIHTIDFDSFRMCFGDASKEAAIKQILENYECMVNTLNSHSNTGVQWEPFPKVNSLDEAYSELDIMKRKVLSIY